MKMKGKDRTGAVRKTSYFHRSAYVCVFRFCILHIVSSPEIQKLGQALYSFSLLYVWLIKLMTFPSLLLLPEKQFPFLGYYTYF